MYNYFGRKYIGGSNGEESNEIKANSEEATTKAVSGWEW